MWSALYGVAGVMLTSMSLGVLLRAGIDIERGSISSWRGLRTGARQCVSARKRGRAEPLAVIGEGVLEYLAYLEGRPIDSTSAAIARSMAPLARSLICHAPDDSQPMLHMLAPALLEFGPLFTSQPRMHIGGRSESWSRIAPLATRSLWVTTNVCCGTLSRADSRDNDMARAGVSVVKLLETTWQMRSTRAEC